MFKTCYVNTTSTSAGFCISTVAQTWSSCTRLYPSIIHTHTTREIQFSAHFFSACQAPNPASNSLHRWFWWGEIAVFLEPSTLPGYVASMCLFLETKSSESSSRTNGSCISASNLRMERDQDRSEAQHSEIHWFEGMECHNFGILKSRHRAYSGSLEKSPVFSRSDSQGFQTASRMLHSAPDSKSILRAVRYAKESFCFTCVPLGRCGFNMVTSRLRRGFRWEQFYQYAMILSGVTV